MANILIIDDKPYMSHLISEDLSCEGHSITCFKNPEAVISEFPSYMPDIVLFDIYSRGLEDWETLHDIKKGYPGIPVIILSAFKNFLIDPRFEEADGYVIKSIYTDELKRKIAEILVQ